MSLLPEITSSHNPYFRKCLRLREGRKRRQLGQFLIDGNVEIGRAISAGIRIDRILLDDQPLPPELQSQLDEHSIQVQRFSAVLLKKLSYGQLDSQPIAVAFAPSLPLEALQLNSSSMVLVLDRTEKPGNLGACLRSAAACGVSAVILTDPICDPFNANAIRASRGTMFRVPLAITSSEAFLELAQRIALPVFAARVDSKTSLWQMDLGRGGAIVFGNEAEGLNQDWSLSHVRDFTIPMSSLADSLNLSISAAVTLYESFRQRANLKI